MASTDLKLSDSSIEVGTKARKVFESYMRRTLGQRRVKAALLLSGGIDSAVAGIAATRVGHDVVAYTFQLGDETTFDSKWAQHTAQVMGWKWNLIKFPTDVESILALWPTMYDDYSCRLKRNFECLWPLLMVYPHVREKFVITGLAADNHFAPSRKSAKLGAREDKKVLDGLRREAFSAYHKRGVKAFGPDYNPANLWMNYQAEKFFGKTGVNPYLEKEFYDLLSPFEWEELHKPRQKHHVAGIYPDALQYIGHRNHRNYQNEGKIDDHFEQCLDTIVNFRKRKRALEMYADWRRYPDECRAVCDKLKAKYAKRAKKLLTSR